MCIARIKLVSKMLSGLSPNGQKYQNNAHVDNTRISPLSIKTWHELQNGQYEELSDHEDVQYFMKNTTV